MPKFTVQNGSVVALNDKKERETFKVGAVLELTDALAQKMDPTGFYLCPSAKYVKGKTFTPKAAAKVAEEDEDEEDLDEDEELEKATRPSAKPTPAK